MVTAPAAYGPAELMAVAMARLLRDGEVVFQGVNSPLPMVAIALARRLHAPHLTYVNIAGGVDPTPRYLPDSTTDAELAHGSASLFNNEDFYDLCARGGIDTAFLGAVQIDAQGRTNVSAIGDHAHPKVRLPGGGGAAMIMPTARRVILWRAQHSPRVFVERLDFVTAAGNVDRVVTPLCVFQRRAGRLQVEAVFPTSSAAEIVARTGFPLDAARPWPALAPPTPDELAALAAVDPRGVRHQEFRDG
ncbi:MAG TPA: CoA-transferase [Chloroflexota bacterium]|nr:CoA-transferase [Chloroflexota bacterium]